MSNYIDRDWTEDRNFENGNYCSTCCKCGKQFIGQKRRVICKICSEAPVSTEEKLYSHREFENETDEICQLYTKHLNAMTVEGLYDKSDIAWELAYRDLEINRLRSELAALKEDCAGERPQ